MSFVSINEDQENQLLSGLVSGSYSLILGAGASYDSTNHLGHLPLAHQLTEELAFVTGAPRTSSLQRLFSTLTQDEVRKHVTERLSGSTPGPTYQIITNYNWKRIFTFNIDDAIEASYNTSKRQKLQPIHFSDAFRDYQTAADLPLIYLHGSVRYPERGYVFSRDQYIRMMKGDNPWMVVLSNAIKNDPVIISGSSMDEVDLEYYLSFRSPTSSRDDVGPSIFVSSEVSRISKNFCDEHNLVQFQGHSIDFFSYLRSRIPNPPLVEERISAGIRDILPASISKAAAMHLDADFELVPRLNVNDVSSNKFYYGHPPTWSDLSARLDISRRESPDVVSSVEHLSGAGRHILTILGPTGSGKTTILKRVAYNLAALGRSHVLWASELGRLSKSTASTIDLIGAPITLMVDNLADHARSISDVLSVSERDDLLVIGAERLYRRQYLDRVFGSAGYTQLDVHGLSEKDVDRLIQTMLDRQLVGSPRALSQEPSFLRSIQRDPIAVATCRVLNDFRPLNRIVVELVEAADAEELSIFSAVGLAEHCFKGGIRREIVSQFADRRLVNSMLERQTGLSLRYVDRSREYLVTENSTLTEEILSHLTQTSSDVLHHAFLSLSKGLAPYVNRHTIRSRAPEARLAGRIFDFDDIVERFLGDRAEEFYEESKEAWRWNSRYWEQAALLMLEKSRRSVEVQEKRERLEEALQRARYSVAIEEHSFGLTTLATVLMTFLEQPFAPDPSIFDEGLQSITRAIELEQRHSRVTQHPFSVLLHGTLSYLSSGGALSSVQKHRIRTLVQRASRRWSADVEIRTAVERLERAGGF